MMLRAKSPFKKRSPKIDDNNEMSAPTRPLLHHYSSVQEFQELQKQQQLLNGNAWAQQKVHSRTNSQIGVDEPDTPQTGMGDIILLLESDDSDSNLAMNTKTPKAKKKAPPPLKLVPDAARKAVPTQRDSLENKKHGVMQAQLNMVAHNSNDEYSLRIRSSTVSSPNASIEHIARPKSPGKKLFQKFFRHHTSSEIPPKISPEFEETPEKAVKILGKESLNRKKESKASSKMRSSNEEKIVTKLDFKCAGEGTRSRADTIASATISTPSTADFDAPTDREIRGVGGIGRYATRVPTTDVQRTVSETATMNTISAAIENKYDRASDGYTRECQHRHLQYINNAIPPTPPSKDSRREQMMRPSVTEVPSMDLTDNPDTPNTTFRVASRGDRPSPLPLPLHLPSHLPRYNSNEYLNLVLNKPSVPSLRGTSLMRSAYGFVISPSAELANGSSPNSPVSHFIQSPINPRSAGLPSSRDASPGATPLRSRALSRRWSDTSLSAWKAQSEMAMPCLPPTFYSPYNFSVPAEYRNFTHPTANDDPSLYYFPQASTSDLESFASRKSSEGKPAPLTSAESSFAPDKGIKDHSVLDKDATPVSKQRRFVVKKHCSSNIAAAARTHPVHGLGLSPLINEAMNHVSRSSSGSKDASFSSGPASAMPQPLNVFPQATMESLPAKEELDAFLTLHLHLDQKTTAIHHFIDRKFEQSIQAMNTKHDETLKVLSASFAEILAKVSGIDEKNIQMDRSLGAFKADMNDKIMDMVGLLQEKVLNPMSQMMESNAQLDKSVSHLIARIAELEKNQKDFVEAVKAKEKPNEQSVTLTPISLNPSPAPSTDTSPHHSCAAQNFAVSYPTPYTSNHVTSTSGAAYGYVPYYMDNGAYAAPQGWNGKSLDAGFAKLSRGQRVQHIQGRYVTGGIQMPSHPAFKNGDRKSGVGQNVGKDGTNEI